MNTLNSKFVEELGWELINQDIKSYTFQKPNTNIYFIYSFEDKSIICNILGEVQVNYFVGKIKTGQFFIDLLESIF